MTNDNLLLFVPEYSYWHCFRYPNKHCWHLSRTVVEVSPSAPPVAPFQPWNAEHYLEWSYMDVSVVAWEGSARARWRHEASRNYFTKQVDNCANLYKVPMRMIIIESRKLICNYTKMWSISESFTFKIPAVPRENFEERAKISTYMFENNSAVIRETIGKLPFSSFIWTVIHFKDVIPKTMTTLDTWSNKIEGCDTI